MLPQHNELKITEQKQLILDIDYCRKCVISQI